MILWWPAALSMSIMSFQQRTVRYSTVVRLVFTSLVLAFLLVTILTLVVLDLVFTISQGLNGPSSRGHQYEPRERQINEEHSSIETFILENRAALQAGSSSVMMSGEEKDGSSRQIRDNIIIRDKINELKGHQQHHQFPGIKKPENVTLDRLHQEFFNYLAGHLLDTPYPGVEHYTRYAVARLGLSPVVNVEPLIGEFGPVINDVLSFKYPISIPSCVIEDSSPDSSSSRNVFFAVNSAPGNFDRRHNIRQTWRNHLKDAHRERHQLATAGFTFTVGLTDDAETQHKIEQEAKTYGDIIQIGVEDFYRNLSLKVAGLFNWLYRFCAKVDFVMKVDDDVYVNVRNLAHFVHDYYYQSNLSMFGISLPNNPFVPQREGKWSITVEEWPWDNYPPYLFGPAVLLHGSTIVRLLAAFQTTPMISFDDLYYTGICAEKAGVKVHYSSDSTSNHSAATSSNSSVLSMNLKMFRVPDSCDLRRFIAWLVDYETPMPSINQMNSSHMATINFYHNVTPCIITKPNGSQNTFFDPFQPVRFDFDLIAKSTN